jgi:hypothetical protein
VLLDGPHVQILTKKIESTCLLVSLLVKGYEWLDIVLPIFLLAGAVGLDAHLFIVFLF